VGPLLLLTYLEVKSEILIRSTHVPVASTFDLAILAELAVFGGASRDLLIVRHIDGTIGPTTCRGRMSPTDWENDINRPVAVY
jgi:hypothetical protein